MENLYKRLLLYKFKFIKRLCEALNIHGNISNEFRILLQFNISQFYILKYQRRLNPGVMEDFDNIYLIRNIDNAIT